jgi:hypothetical protein
MFVCYGFRWLRKTAYRWAGDVRKIGSYAGSIDDIVKGELRDEWASLKKEGKWLFEEIDMSVISIRSRVGIPLSRRTKVPVQYHQRLQQRL